MTTDTLPPLDSIRSLTANYSDRQGLRIVPLALMLIAQTLPRPYAVPPTVFGLDMILITIIVGLGGYFLIGHYYVSRFGRVEELPSDGIPISAQIALVVFCFFASVMIDIVGRPPIFLSGMVIAAWLIATAWPSRHIRSYYLTTGLVLGLISLEPLWGEPLGHLAQSYALTFGVMLLLAGVRDHIEFVRLFPRMEAEHD